MKILFQGDSVTDAGRNYADGTDLGPGYPKYAAEAISEAFPEFEFEFINRGISGNRTENLIERWSDDCISLSPDVVFILIGVNDTWHHADDGFMPDELFERNYRSLLERLKAETSAKIIIIEQFLLDFASVTRLRRDLDAKIQVTRRLARLYADAFIPLDGLLAAASVYESPDHWSADGIHPSAEGARLIGAKCAEALAEIL